MIWITKDFFFFYFIGDSEFSETLEKCLECMHTNEVCVIPCDNGNLEQEFAISTEVDLWCEIELLSFFKVCIPMHKCNLNTVSLNEEKVKE